MSQEVMVTLALFGLANLVAVMVAWMNLNVRVKALEVTVGQHQAEIEQQKILNESIRSRIHEVGNNTQKILGILEK